MLHNKGNVGSVFMPVVKIYLKKRNGIDKKLIAFTVREILKDVFKVPANDGPVKFFEIDESDWFMPDGWEEEKVFIELLILPGRKKETKAKLLKEITEQVSNILKIDKNAIIITLHEPSPDNWGFKGGQQASQIGVTFKLDV